MDEPNSQVRSDLEPVEAADIAQARVEIAEGRGVPHERVREWLLRLAAGEKVAPPAE